MGTYPGQTVQGFDQEPDTRTDTGSRRYVHRPDQECYHLVPCRQCRHQWGNDARYDDGHAVHHRPAQRPHIAVHQFRAGHAGCENLARTPERNSGKPDEEPEDAGLIRDIPENAAIEFRNVVFQYEGPHSDKVLDGIDLTIPHDKVTAIVGESGSGKTTLLK